jgi:hypothetical protein
MINLYIFFPLAFWQTRSKKRSFFFVGERIAILAFNCVCKKTVCFQTLKINRQISGCGLDSSG